MNARDQVAADLAFFVHETLELANPDAVPTLARLANNVLDAINLQQLKLAEEEIERRKLLAEWRRPARTPVEEALDSDRVASARHTVMTKDVDIEASMAPLPANVVRFPIVPRQNMTVV